MYIATDFRINQLIFIDKSTENKIYFFKLHWNNLNFFELEKLIYHVT